MKKLTSLLLVLAMLLSLCATMAVSEEEKPFKGQHFVIWDDYRRYVINTDTNEPSAPQDTSILIYAAYEEWAKENECTIEIVWGNHDALRGAIDSGDVPLIWNANSNWPQEPVAGLCQPFSAELQATLAEKFGSGIMDMFQFKGEVYGALYPWSGTQFIQFNQTKCEELGIKTPVEYYAEGNWTFETYFQFLRDCTIDVDGDGKLDYKGYTRHDTSGYPMPHVMFNEEGRLVSVLENEMQREWFDRVYTAYTVDSSLEETNNKLQEYDGCYILSSAGGNIEPWRPDTYAYYKDGDVILAVPAPSWKAGDTSKTYYRHNLYMMIPTGCKNVAAAESLIAYVYDRVMAEVEIMAYGELTGKYTKMTGTTELAKKVIDAHDTKIAQLAADAEEIGVDFSATREYAIEWFLNNNNWHILINAPGVARFITQDSKYEAIWKLPSATSIAQIAPVLQAQCDAFNALYIDGLAD